MASDCAEYLYSASSYDVGLTLDSQIRVRPVDPPEDCFERSKSVAGLIHRMLIDNFLGRKVTVQVLSEMKAEVRRFLAELELKQNG